MRLQAVYLATGPPKELPSSSPWQHLPYVVETHTSDVAKEPGLRRALQDVAAHSIHTAGEEKSGHLPKQLPPELTDRVP